MVALKWGRWPGRAEEETLEATSQSAECAPLMVFNHRTQFTEEPGLLHSCFTFLVGQNTGKLPFMMTATMHGCSNRFK